MADKKKTTTSTSTGSTAKKKGTGVGRNGNLQPVRTSEEAKKRGRNGGLKAAETKREKKTAREAAELVLSMKTVGDAEVALKELGFVPKDRTNVVAIMARLALRAQNGDLESAKLLLKYAGQDSEENRKERESDARVAAIMENGNGAALSFTSNESESSDVVIYLPEIEKLDDEEEVDKEDVANGEEDT